LNVAQGIRDDRIEGNMTDRGRAEKVKFLTVIWGKRYIEEFAKVSLPSYLAPGNLPFLAEAENLELLILTSAASKPYFEKLKIFRKLKAICPVRFLFIDDLITTGNYGVTLTLAYARGIMDSGEEQTNTCFVFMNADFVLADGSLRTLVARLREGHDCIMAPSLRACSETTFPRLLEAVDSEEMHLAMRPRDMVQLAFDNLHPTVIGKTLTQNFVRCITHNQFYWQVGPQTLLGRYHLIFMQAIRPEKPLTVVNSYCDYGFVPEMIPSGRFHILDDSDDFFLLELQPTEAEKEYLHCGPAHVVNIASSLSGWTTREHRRFAGVDVVFHTHDLPPSLPAARKEAARFVEAVQAAMSREPVDHVDHYYWVFGLQAWHTLKDAQARPQERKQEQVVEIFHAPTRRLTLAEYFRRGYLWLIVVAQRLTGAKPNVALWHNLWLDSKLVLDWARRAAQKKGAANLVVGDPNNPLAAAIAKRLRADLMSRAQILDRALPPRAAYDGILIHVFREDVHISAESVRRIEPYLAPNGTIALFVEHLNSELDGSNFTGELAQYARSVLPPDWLRYSITARFVGGRAKRYLRLFERRLLRNVMPVSFLAWPKAIAAVTLWPLVAGATLLNNLRLSRKATQSMGRPPEFCSAALIEFRRIEDSQPLK
jgi:hypothetical protein